MSNYCAITGSFIQSSIEDNEELFKQNINNILNKVNNSYKEHITSDFFMNEDNKILGLIHSPHMFLEIVESIKYNIKDYKMYFGVAVGLVFTDNINEIIYDADGPLFKTSEQMLKKAKSFKPSICYKSNSIEDQLIMSLLYFIESCKESRTQRQIEIVAAYKEHKSQVHVANKFDIKQPSVSNILKSSLFNEIECARDEIKKYLEIKYL